MLDTERTVVDSLAQMLFGGKHVEGLSLFNADCVELLAALDKDSIDSLVTDPPAGISFMGKAWDSDKGGRDAWIDWMTKVMRECLRVLKPGAHGLVWSLPRTSHWTATALENAGFEIRDVVSHLFGTGFPKSLDVSKAIDKAAGAKREVLGPDPSQAGRHKNTGIVAGMSQYDKTESERVAFITAPATDNARRWQGFGTALKPAVEMWVLVRKPCSEKTVAANVLKWGTGAINVDGCRVEYVGMDPRIGKNVTYGSTEGNPTKFGQIKDKKICGTPTGRFPANLVLSCCSEDSHSEDCAVGMLDRQSGTLKSGALSPENDVKASSGWSGGSQPNRVKNTFIANEGGASRFFYTAKASKSDRGVDNKHPTVKSTKLMSYLCRLVTPPGGTVLDPFMGSGSTGVAALNEGFEFVGIERELEYYETSKMRLCK